MTEQIELLGVNPLPKQTWNYLAINDVKVKVDAPKGPACCIPSRVMAELNMPCGQQASQYLDQAAKTRRIINIEANTKASEPLIVDVDDKTPIASTDITIENNCEVTIVISATSTNKETKGNNLRIVCGDNTKLTIMSVSYMPGKTTYLENVGVSLANNCELVAHQYFLGAHKCIAGVHVDANGDNNTFNSYSNYLVDTRNLTDLNYTADVYGKNSQGDFEARGVLFKRSKKTLRQTVNMHAGCSGSDGKENETVLLAGENITNKSIPSILCHEDNVEGSHGATIGSISKDQLDYLSARGLDKQDINAMFANAIIEDAISHVPSDTTAYELANKAYSDLSLKEA